MVLGKFIGNTEQNNGLKLFNEKPSLPVAGSRLSNPEDNRQLIGGKIRQRKHYFALTSLSRIFLSLIVKVLLKGMVHLKNCPKCPKYPFKF